MTQTKPSAPLAHRRVLVVDDSAACRMIQSAMARALGAEVEVAETAAEAAARCAASSFDLILLDIGLSDADGRVLIRTLREGPAPCEAAVLCVSGLGGEAREASAKAAGADGFAEKPFTSVAAFAAAALNALNAAPDAPLPVAEDARELTAEVAACALDDLDRGGQRLTRAVAEGDMSAARRAAHFLSGVAGVIRDGRLAAASDAVQSATGDSGALRAIEDILARLGDAASRLRGPMERPG